LSSYALEKGKDAKCLVKNRRALYNIYSSFSAIKFATTTENAPETDETT
jgi:hypothetical protein